MPRRPAAGHGRERTTPLSVWMACPGWIHRRPLYLVDMRGYGRSTRPPEMEQPAHLNAPIVRADTAIRDVGSAVDFILRRRGIEKLNLLGWSWGTALMGGFTAASNDKVNKLVLYAPQWMRTTPSLSDPRGELGAYRLVSAAAHARWLAGAPEDKKATLIPPGWFEAWADATFATDPWAVRKPRSCCAYRTAPCRTAPRSGRKAIDLRSRKDHRFGPFSSRGSGSRSADRYDKDIFLSADQCTPSPLGRDRRGDAFDHHGEEQDAPCFGWSRRFWMNAIFDAVQCGPIGAFQHHPGCSVTVSHARVLSTTPKRPYP